MQRNTSPYIGHHSTIDEYTVEYTLTSSAPYFLSLIESSMLLLPIEYDYAIELGEDFGVDNEHMLGWLAY